MSANAIESACNLQNAQLQQQVSLAALKKTNEAVQAQGDAALQLLQTAAEISQAQTDAVRNGVDGTAGVDLYA